MDPAKPSQTALGAAGQRGVHQLIDRPLVHPDPHALTILGPIPPRLPDFAGIREGSAALMRLRAQIIARSRFAEDTLGAATLRGVTQYVLLGAGLDTFAYRNPWPWVRVFEVDHPATQAWKKERLAAASIAPPANVSYAPTNFESEPLSDALARAGFDASRPAVFAWLGVTVYLTKISIETTLRSVAALAPGTDLVFDYGLPRDILPEPFRTRTKEHMDRLAAQGEPWISFFLPDEMAALARSCGFSEIEDIDSGAINTRWFAGRTDGLGVSAITHLIRARV